MIEWLRDGLEGRSLKATLYFYIFGIMALAPIATLIGFLFDANTVFKVTPLLAAILVSIEYGVCYLFSAKASKKDRSKLGRDPATFSKTKSR